MKSITIHGLDEPLWAMLKSVADAEGTSLNKTIKRLLEKALGITPGEVTDKKMNSGNLPGSGQKTIFRNSIITPVFLKR